MTRVLVRCPQCFLNAVKTLTGVTCDTCGYKAEPLQFVSDTYRNDQSHLAWFRAMAERRKAA